MQRSFSCEKGKEKKEGSSSTERHPIERKKRNKENPKNRKFQKNFIENKKKPKIEQKNKQLEIGIFLGIYTLT